ncbi:hypothetical protein EBU58_09630, partial [bacterium]|nr:hypothetical protein [bacterium]
GGTLAFGFAGNPKEPSAMRGGPVREILGDPVWKRSHLPAEIAPAALSASTRVLLSILETWPLPAAFTAPTKQELRTGASVLPPRAYPPKKGSALRLFRPSPSSESAPIEPGL